MQDDVMRNEHLAEARSAATRETLLLLRETPDSSQARVRASAADARAATRQLGERVQAARIAAHLTQVELAGPDYSKSYISAVERGKLTPSFQALGILAERLGVTRSFLLGEDLPLPLLPPPDDPVAEEQQPGAREALEAVLHQERYEEALALCAACERLDWTRETRAAYAQFLAAQGRYADAYQQMAQALQTFQQR